MRRAVWVGVVVAGCFFLATSFRKGWTQVETDFPNYYTAAVLAVHHQPLERFYEWRWFQRQMNYAGTERQLGGYIPQTPLTMLPFVPLAGFAPQTAKQVWLTLNLIFLVATALLLARLTNAPAGVILLIALGGYWPLDGNFVLGQYYVFLLFLLTLGVWSLLRGRAATGGFVLGAICMLKLYAAPFALYFLWKRQWRALVGMAAACVVLGALSVAWFGWHANWFYLTYVLPRAQENAILDPYHPAIGTLTNMLRRMFVMEAELNPHPPVNAPWVFFFLRPALTLAILVLPLLGMGRDRKFEKRELAWFLIAILFASPNVALYVFVVLLLPVALLWDGASRGKAALLVAAYALLSLPLHPAYSWLFPKVWVLLGLFIYAGWKVPVRRALVAGSVIVAISLTDAVRHERSYEREPSRMFAGVETKPHSIYASNPAVSRAGLVFEALGAGTYGYGLNRSMAFDGYAFHPSVPVAGERIVFELVARGRSRVVSVDAQGNDLRTIAWDAMMPAVSPSGKRVAYVAHGGLMADGEKKVAGPVDGASWFPDERHLAYSAKGGIYDSLDGRRLVSGVAGELSEVAVSPDGQRLAFTATSEGIRHVWVADLQTGRAREITGGTCNSYAAAWEMDANGLIFASDCGRGLGLPRLYRAVGMF